MKVGAGWIAHGLSADIPVERISMLEDSSGISIRGWFRVE